MSNETLMKDLSDIYAGAVAEGSLRPDPAQARVIARLDALAQELSDLAPRRGFTLFRRAETPPRGLYIWGGVGRGKSMLMDLFFEHARIEPRRRVHFHAFMQEVHQALHAARKTGVDDAILPVAEQIIASARLLCFDEMQISDITDAMIVGRLFEQLFAAGVVVVTTSNRVPGDLYKDGLNRNLFLPFIDLITDRLDVLQLDSDTDYRQDRLSREKRYFTPINAKAKAAMQAMWDDLTGGEGAPLILTVNKREVTLPAYRNGVARARFFDLCARPLGPADYLAIAGAVRVLLLDDIPHLSRSNFNEAKRFVILIDALYEARVRLIASAEAPPNRLYLEGEGAFEFERTASRLEEMQDADWGSDAG